MKALTLRQLQAEVGEWHARNWPAATPTNIVFKAVEEVAELAAAHNHLLSGADTYEKQIDAIADVVIVLAALCAKLGADFEQIVAVIWGEVSQRSPERLHRLSTVAQSYAEPTSAERQCG